jgi:hypothetical protein
MQLWVRWVALLGAAVALILESQLCGSQPIKGNAQLRRTGLQHKIASLAPMPFTFASFQFPASFCDILFPSIPLLNLVSKEIPFSLYNYLATVSVWNK